MWSSKILLVIVLGIFLSCSVSAVVLSQGTYLNSSVSNSSMSFNTINVTVDLAKVYATGVELYNASYSNGGLTVSLTTPINWTTVNTNIDSSEYPRITSNLDRTRVFSSSLTQTVSGSFTFTITEDCSELNKITYNGVDYEGQAARTFCSNSVITLSSIPTGTTTLTYEVGTSRLVTSTFSLLIGLLALGILLYAVGGFMYYVRNEFGDIDTSRFIKWIVGLVIVVFVMIVLMEYIAKVS